MTLAILDIEVELFNKPRLSSHAFHIEDGRPITADLDYPSAQAFGWTGLFSSGWEDRTDPLDELNDPQSIIEACIYLHRYMQHASATIRGLYLRSVPHDSYLKAPGLSKRVNVTCRGVPIAIPEDDLETANNTLQIAKNTITIGGDGGMLYLRGAISKESTIGDGNDGVYLQEINVPIYADALKAAIGQDDPGSGLLADFFGTYPVATSEGKIYYVVPSTAESAVVKTRRGNPKRYVNGYEVVQAMEIVDATQRDTRRRGRKAATAPEGV